MRSPTPHLSALLLATLTLAACTTSPEREAVRAFESFQDALFAGDRDALRPLLSSSSQPVCEQLPLERTKGKQRLVVTGVRARPPEYEIVLADPNAQDAPATFVVVRENGRFVVDLVRTTAFHHEQRDNPSGTRTVTPRAITADEIERIRPALASPR
jgi:hypothetical protein